jgi:2-phospho-L-lactate guanylyltransferase
MSEEKRASLSEALLKRVTHALEKSRIEKTILVSSDKHELEGYLQKTAKVVAISESKHHGGVNCAMMDGLALVPKDSPTILLPSDLPLITEDAINDVLNLLQNHDLVIVPSRRKDGTNLLGFNSSKTIPLHYDNDSYPNHLLEARSHGLEFVTVEREELSFDIDDQNDLIELMDRFGTKDFDELSRKMAS